MEYTNFADTDSLTDEMLTDYENEVRADHDFHEDMTLQLTDPDAVVDYNGYELEFEEAEVVGEVE